MPRKEQFSFRIKQIRGKLLFRETEMFGSDKEGKVWIGSKIVQPGAEFYKLGEEWVFFRLTKNGQETMKRAKNQAERAMKQEELEMILETALGELFYGGATKIENLELSTRVHNLLLRISRSDEVDLRSFLREGKGLPPLLWVGAFAFWTKADLEAIRGLGPGSMEEITSMLKEYRLPLPTERIS